MSKQRISIKGRIPTIDEARRLRDSLASENPEGEFQVRKRADGFAVVSRVQS